MSKKAYLLEDRIKRIGHYLLPGLTLTVGRNSRCDISTLNPKTIEPGYTIEEKIAAGHVSGIHFYISYERDGNIYLWDNESTNGLYIKQKEEIDLRRIFRRTVIHPGTSIFASMGYEFFLREKKIDIDAQKSAEERASAESTRILMYEETF
ncbi:FHA domain protein [uncultured archaeon]|nr:FHA domain protein [uncultured archaeon]